MNGKSGDALQNGVYETVLAIIVDERSIHQERSVKSMSHPLVQQSAVNSTGFPDLTAIGGISEEEAQRRLNQEGFNELPSSRWRSLPGIALGVVRDLFAFSLPSPLELQWCLAAGIASLLWFEAVKILTRRFVRHG